MYRGLRKIPIFLECTYNKILSKNVICETLSRSATWHPVCLCYRELEKQGKELRKPEHS